MAPSGISQPHFRSRRGRGRAVQSRVERALRELPLSETDIAAVAPPLSAGLARFHCGSPSDSPFFDMRGKVTAMSKHFARKGLTLPQYVRAACRNPQLFVKAPASLIANVEAVAHRFKPNGLTLRSYLQAALKGPPLFAMSSATIISHLGFLIEMRRRGLLTFPGEDQIPPEQPLAPLFAYLSNWPMCLTFADENLSLRLRYAQVTGERPEGTKLLSLPRRRIEEALARALDNPRPGPQ